MELYRSLPPEAVQILLVLFLSFMVGLEREEHKAAVGHYSFGGVRTFPLIGLIGYSMDQQQRLHQQAPQTYVRVEQGQPLSVADVRALGRAGISDDVIISQIRNSHTVYHLSAADIIDLRDAGVSNRVIDFMINTPGIYGAMPAPQANTVVVAQPPPPPPVETVVVTPGPDYVWIDGEWVWNGQWFWVGGHWGYPPYPHAVWVRGYWGRGPHGWSRVPGHWR